MRTVTGLILAHALLLLGLGAAAAQTTEVPFKALMDTARAHAVVAAFDRDAFEHATASYPRDDAGGTMAVRTGNYMMWKIVHLFPSDRTVERIALPVFALVCAPRKSQYATTVACRLSASFAVTDRGATRRINLVVNRNVGRFVLPKPGEDMGVVQSGVAATVDDAVNGLAVHLKRMGVL